MDNKQEYDPVYGYVGDQADDTANEAAQQTTAQQATVQQTPAAPENADSVESRIRKTKRGAFIRGVIVGVCSLMAILLVIVIGIAIHTLTHGLGGTFTSDVESKVAFIEALIREYYYKDVDDETMTEGIYAGIVDSLGDDYSAYYTPEEYQDEMVDTTGNYGGIGASLQKDPDTGMVEVVRIFDGVPAVKAGLKQGDILISADGNIGQELDLDVFVHYIRGEEGSTVEIVYERDGEQNTVNIVRELISIPTIDHRMLKDDIGYIEISEFNLSTGDDFKAALEDLQSQDMKALIVDLRSNPGGLVDTCTDILDMILPEGTTVYMEEKDGDRTTYKSDAANYIDIPIAVLINDYSASASEIFAGAIRDFHYGTLIGTKSYGKGVVQVTLPLNDGSAVKITIAQYFTPSGECIDGVGITPDVEIEYEYSGDEDADEYDYYSDNQVNKAIEILTKEMGGVSE